MRDLIDPRGLSRYDPLTMSNIGSTLKFHKLLPRGVLGFVTVGTALCVARQLRAERTG